MFSLYLDRIIKESGRKWKGGECLENQVACILYTVIVL